MVERNRLSVTLRKLPVLLRVTAGFRTLTPHITNVLLYIILFNVLPVARNSAARSAVNPVIISAM